MSDVQLNVRISDEANDKLLEALERHSRVSKQALIEELLLLYLDHWEEMQAELPALKRDWIKQQLGQRERQEKLPEKRKTG